MAGLFSTPEQVAAAEGAPLSQAGVQDTLRGSLFNLGNVGGRAIRGAVGGDPRSPAQIRAQKVQELARQIDFKDQASIVNGINMMNESGFQAEAFKLGELLTDPVDPAPTFKEETRTITDPNTGETKIIKGIFGSDGSFTKIGEFANNPPKEDTSGGPQLSQSLFKGLNIADEDSTNMLLRLSDMDEFKSILPGGGLDDDDVANMKGFVGEIKSVATQMKEADLAKALPLFQAGHIDKDQMSLMFDNIADQRYLRAGYKQWIEGGGFNKSLDEGIGGADVVVQGDVDTTNLDTLQANSEEIRLKNEALADVASRVDQLVVGDPRTGEFRLNKMSPQQAGEVFSRMDQKSDEQIMQELQGQGFQFNDQLFETHAQRWQLMRENPVAVAKFLSLNDSPDLRDAELTRVLNQIEDDNNFPAFAQTAEVFKYLKRLSVKDKKKQRRGRGGAL